jgi:hypothetical protein
MQGLTTLTETVDGVIGVDTHRDTLAAAAVTAIGATLGHTEAFADAGGYRRLLQFAQDHLPNRRCWAPSLAPWTSSACSGECDLGSRQPAAATRLERGE